jgi:3-dehydroquinate synthase
LNFFTPTSNGSFVTSPAPASPNSCQTVTIELAEISYQIKIGNGLLHQLGTFLRECQLTGKAFVISDQHVAPLYLDSVKRAGEEADIPMHAITIEAGEPSKSLRVVERILEEMCDCGADRQSSVIALGGGVVGDLAGFVASAYARGIALVQIPTTLLAQVDSSVGGKTGVNLSRAKNMVGAFWQPRGVIADIATLNTLPQREYRAGLAEVVKYGMILDADFFAFLEQNVARINAQDAATLSEIVARCCQLKATVVQKDERELTGLRAVLNYGHTFGHAFEALAGYGNILHGEAVAMGMNCAARLAQQLGMIDAEIVSRQLQLLLALQIPVKPPEISYDDFAQAILRDKKAAAGKARFILPDCIGQMQLIDNIDSRVAYACIGDEK